MADLIDIHSVERLYGYVPPELPPGIPLHLEWESVKESLKARLAEIFSQSVLPSLPFGETLFQESVESAEGPLQFRVKLSKMGKGKVSFFIDLEKGISFQESSIATFWFHGLHTDRWKNVHRRVGRSFRGQGISKICLDLAHHCAAVRAQWLQRSLEIHAGTFQLDVLNMYLRSGYEPQQPERLERIRGGDSGLHLEGPPARGEAWMVMTKKNPFMIDLAKRFQP